MNKFSIILVFACFSILIQAKNTSKPLTYTFGSANTANGTFNIDSTCQYSDIKGYGINSFGRLSQEQSSISAEKPFYFSVKLPEGHYKVTIAFGGNQEGSSTMLKAESRRLFFEEIITKPGEKVIKELDVDIRYPKINDSVRLKIKPREKNYLNWDEKLTLEFNGTKPCVSSVEIESANNLPTIFLAGNSTVTDQEYEPWASWGQMFPCFLKANVVVANYAESGETLLAFKRENRLLKILSQMKKGDYLLMEFAHNDQKEGGNHLDPFTTYKDELKYYISETRKKRGIPVLVTSTNRRSFDENGKIRNTLGDYPEAMRQLAKEEKVMIIDLNAMSKELYEALGPENSKKAFVHYDANTYPGQLKPLADNTHFNPFGAYELAKCVVQSIITNKYPLKKYIRGDWKMFDPEKPDSIPGFKWFNSPSVDMVKPDGN